MRALNPSESLGSMSQAGRRSAASWTFTVRVCLNEKTHAGDLRMYATDLSP